MISPTYAIVPYFLARSNRVDVLFILKFDAQNLSWNSTIIWRKFSDHKVEATRDCIHKSREVEQK